jgi:hypothetical protein
MVFRPDNNCSGMPYEECVSEAVNTVEFTVAAVASSGGTYRAYTPVIKIVGQFGTAPLAGMATIEYQATDENDNRGEHRHGLRQRGPVDVFYSPPRSFNFVRIAKDRPARGTISWDTTQLPDGEGYRLKITATGEDNDVGTIIVENLTIDNTPPFLIVRTQIGFSRGEPIAFDIESSETLSRAPTFIVSQWGLMPREVVVAGPVPGRRFTAEYEPVPGHDGPAFIEVRAVDRAGNPNRVTEGAKAVTIGIESPPPPTILSPAQSDLRITDSRLASLEGIAGPTVTRVVLTVNGTKEYEKPYDPAVARFGFDRIPLDPMFNKGKNIVSIRGFDAEGRPSVPAILTVTVNRPPTVTLLDPRGKSVKLGGLVPIRWEGVDPNDDRLTYHLEISSDRGRTWNTIAQALDDASFVWNSLAVPDGNTYMIRVTATDGLSSGSAASGRIAVENGRPIIALESDEDVFTTNATLILKGFARASGDRIIRAETSLDGVEWQPFVPTDGAWDSDFERFELSIPGRGAPKRTVSIRGTTASGRVVVSAQRVRVVFDAGAPTIRLERPAARPLNRRTLDLQGIAEDREGGLRGVEYRIDDSPWYTVRAPGGASVHGKRREWSFSLEHPAGLSDGTHTIAVRAVDEAGNISEVSEYRLTVDATPPRVGSFLLTDTAGKPLFPEGRNFFRVREGQSFTLRMAVAGRPSRVELFRDGHKVPITFHEGDGLWEGTLVFPESGTVMLRVGAYDAAGNSVQKTIGRFVVSAERRP